MFLRLYLAMGTHKKFHINLLGETQDTLICFSTNISTKKSLHVVCISNLLAKIRPDDGYFGKFS